MLTTDANKAVNVIRKLGGRPLLVGGCVRDHILGIKSKDIDIEVHGPVTPVQVQNALLEVGRVDAVGMSFGVLKFGRDVDISFPRRDSRTGDGHTGFTIQVDPTMTIEEALSRRDFTINSMAMDTATGEVIDPFGGLADLREGLIRHTSDAFSDDPLRVLRAVQFSARLNMSIADETLTLCRELAPRLVELSKERIWVEWEKILTKGISMDRVGDAIDQIGLLGMFPGWERESTWFTDEMLGENRDLKGERRERMILGTQFLSRPEVLDDFLRLIDAPIWLRRDAKLLASRATRTDWAGVSCASQARQLSRQFKSVTLRDRLIVKQAQGCDVWLSAEAQGILDAPLKPLLTGEHLKDLGMTPGPVFGKILKEALEVQDREGWTTETEALAWFQARLNHWSSWEDWAS